MTRKMYRSGVWKTAACLISVFLLSACANGTTRKKVTFVPPSSDTLRVGVTPDFAPLIYKRGGEIIGLEAELAKELGRFLGKSVVFIEVPWEDQIEALLENKTDIIMSGMSWTKMREARISFSETYMKTGQIGLVRRGDKHRFPKGYFGLYGNVIVLKIGVVKGTTGEGFVEKQFGAAKKIVAFDTPQEAVRAIGKGEFDPTGIDLIILDAPIAYLLAAENEKVLAPLPYLLTGEDIAWGIKKNDAELLKSANEFIETMKRTGKLDRIVKRWIPSQDA